MFCFVLNCSFFSSHMRNHHSFVMKLEPLLLVLYTGSRSVIGQSPDGWNLSDRSNLAFGMEQSAQKKGRYWRILTDIANVWRKWNELMNQQMFFDLNELLAKKRWKYLTQALRFAANAWGDFFWCFSFPAIFQSETFFFKPRFSNLGLKKKLHVQICSTSSWPQPTPAMIFVEEKDGQEEENVVMASLPSPMIYPRLVLIGESVVP